MLRKLKTWIFRKAVIFDYDGVLNDSISIVRELYNELYRRGVINRCFKSDEEFSYFFQGDMHKNLEVAGMELTEENIKINDALVKEVHPSLDKNAKLYKGVDELLLKLKHEGYKLGIVSNGDRAVIQAKLKEYNLESVVDAIVGYGEVSKGKPSPEGLLKCLEKLKVKPERALYVGDMESDVKTARAAGIEIVAVTYGYLKFRSDIYDKLKNADYFARNIDEIYERVEKWSRKSRKSL